MFRHVLSALALAALIWLQASGALRAHEGHDHAEQAPAAPTSASPRGEARSDRFELVALAQADHLTLYVDDYRTNAPIEKASVEVETPDGPKSAVPLGNGIYRLDAPFLAKHLVKGGHVDLIVTVAAGDDNDILPLSIDIPEAHTAKANPAPKWFEPLSHSPWTAGIVGFVFGGALVWFLRRRQGAVVAALVALALLSADHARAHEGHDDSDKKPSSAASDQRALREADGSVFVPKPIQRIFGLRTILTETGSFVPSVELPGRVIPDPNASGYVQTAVGGMLTPPPGGFPRLGTPVKQGEVLAYVTPPLQAIDVSDMRQKQGELDQQISIVQRRLARYESLVTSGSVARTQVEDTKLELEGLRDRRTALDAMRRESVPLVAPVSGVIAEGTPVTGQIAQSNAVVFHIVTPGKLWIEALSFDAVAGSGRASAKTGNGIPLKLAFRGSGLADRSQSIPVHFAIEGDSKGLRAGQFVTVFTETGETRPGIAVPRNAVVRAANGQDFVFEHTTAERFAPRPVRVEPLDAERVLIAAGIDPGKRVVVQGAELLDHVR
jgi:hypothetical protein